MESLSKEKHDSPEELWFHHWLKEAENAGYVENVQFHPEAFLLMERASRLTLKRMKTKNKVTDMFLLHPHSYTADFKFEATEKFQELDHKLVSMDNKTFFIDVKGGYNIYNNVREFRINQKLVYYRYGIYVNEVVPKTIFVRTFCPQICQYTEKTFQPRKHYYAMPSISEALKCTKIKSKPIEWVDR